MARWPPPAAADLAAADLAAADLAAADLAAADPVAERRRPGRHARHAGPSRAHHLTGRHTRTT